MAIGLTTRQRECLDFIQSYVGERGVPPTFSEIAQSQGISSKSGVSRLLVALEARGHIRRLTGRARAIELIEDRPQRCPHCHKQIPIRRVPPTAANDTRSDGQGVPRPANHVAPRHEAASRAGAQFREAAK